MASAKNSRSSKTASSVGRITPAKAKKMNHSRVEYPEPFEKNAELYKEGKGTERWATKQKGVKKPPNSGKRKAGTGLKPMDKKKKKGK